MAKEDWLETMNAYRVYDSYGEFIVIAPTVMDAVSKYEKYRKEVGDFPNVKSCELVGPVKAIKKINNA